MEKYKTFWKRLFAAIIDGLVFVPIIWLGSGLEQGNNRLLYIGWLLLYTGLVIFYSVFLHALYGQTLGKRIMNIKVIDLSETKVIGFKRAFYREIIWFACNLTGIIVLIYQSKKNAAASLETLKIQFEDFIFLTSLIWLIIELLTMLTNPKRRAVHDFLAQSVVVDTTM